MKAITISTNNADVKPDASFKIKSKELGDLLDSGASLNFLGLGCKELIKELDEKVKPVNSIVKTVDGKRHEVIGKTESEVVFRDKSISQTFYLCPALTIPVILGVPFWKSFDLAPTIFSNSVQNVTAESVEAVVAETSLEKSESLYEKHTLSEQQQQKLNTAINSFRSFE